MELSVPEPRGDRAAARPTSRKEPPSEREVSQATRVTEGAYDSFILAHAFSFHRKRSPSLPEGGLRAIREYYYIAIFARVLENKFSDTSSLDYPPLRKYHTHGVFLERGTP